MDIFEFAEMLNIPLLAAMEFLATQEDPLIEPNFDDSTLSDKQIEAHENFMCFLHQMELPPLLKAAS